MQDLRASMEMGSSGGGIGDRRLRSLKCPRCDSLNTKFCYYNNYNLSQPRHFCKNCRRYWTKGGVLQNVPVGGGIRKTKQTQKSSSSSNPDKHHSKKSSSSSTLSHHHHQKQRKISNSNSNSATTITTHEAASDSSSAAYYQQLLNFNDSATGFASQTTTTNPNSTGSELIHQQHHHSSLDDQGIHDNDQGILQEPSSFTSLITGTNHGYLGFNLSDVSPFRLHHQQEEQQQYIGDRLEQVQKMKTSISMGDELKMQFDQKNDQLKLQELTKNFYDQTVEMPGLTPLDWQSSNTGNHHHQGLFDLPSAVVDHQVYWSQTSQWTEIDHPLYLP